MAAVCLECCPRGRDLRSNKDRKKAAAIRFSFRPSYVATASRYPCLTRHFCLAKTATAILNFKLYGQMVAMITATGLVMPVFRHGTDRTARDTGATGPLPVEQAVGAMVPICSRRWSYRGIGDYAAAAVGNSLSGNKTVIKTEGSKASGIRSMPLGPRRCPPIWPVRVLPPRWM